MKKPSVMNPKDARKEILRKQRISEILSDESWQAKLDIPEEILALDGILEDSRKPETKKNIKLLQASCDESSKKHGRSVSSPKIKERRKVLLVEQLDRKTGRSGPAAARAASLNHSRPMSADDIQKAKMRAMLMQDKYGKDKSSAIEIPHPVKTSKDRKVSRVSQIGRNRLPGVPRIPRLPLLRCDEERVPPDNPEPLLRCDEEKVPPERSEEASKASIDLKAASDSREQVWEKLRSRRLQWRTPPEMKGNDMWGVVAGENSKEIEVQTGRIRRERETFYSNTQDIPPNPKEPWDTEMDFDDSLTPEIPMEQPPDADAATTTATGEDPSCSPLRGNVKEDLPTAPPLANAPPGIDNGAPPEPDLELLAVLLKNPDLVFALTSGQGKSMSSEETVALLDMIKKSGVGLEGLLNGTGSGSGDNKPLESEPMSLPSPTPPSNSATMSGWIPAKAAVVHQPQPPLQMPSPAVPAHVPIQSSRNPLTITINPAPQHHVQALNYLPQQWLPADYHLQQNPHPEATNRYLANAPAAAAGFQPALRQQSPLLAEPTPLQPGIHTWQLGDAAAAAAAILDSRSGAKSSLELPDDHARFPVNDRYYNNYPNRPPLHIGVFDGPSMDNGLGRLSDFGTGRNFSDQRRGPDWDNNRPEWSNHRNSGHRGSYHGGGRRRRDRDWDRRR